MKKPFYCLFCVLLCFVFLSIAILNIAIPSYAYAETNTNTETVFEFIEQYNLSNIPYNVKFLSDFSDNYFKLYEFSDVAYAIYTADTSLFIEGSASAKSPYFGYEGNLYYLGPTYYYVIDNNKVFHTVLNTYSDIPVNESFDFNSLAQNYSRSVSKTSNLSQIYTSNTTQGDNYISHSEYFSEYIYPESSITCGITALCILLGYFDTYHNDNFIPGDNYIFKDSIISESPDDILNWKISSISVKYSFHKLLFDNYMHYNSLIGDIEFIGGYPMADAELKETMIDYLANETDIPSSQIQHHSGAVFFTHQKPRSLLQNNIPVILVLSKYPYQKNSSGDKSDKAWHNVVAYGYNEASDTFIVNYGWAPINGTNYNKIILKDYSVYGYYAMEYSGPHVHSKNGIGYHYFSILDTNFIGTYNICGCTHCEFDDFITL